MEKRPFLNKEAEPTEEKLKQTLGDSFVYYEGLNEITEFFSRNWNFSKGSGWMLRVYDERKALFYLIPLENEFKISMAIRENERKTFLEDAELKTIHGMIKSAKKYREGYALRFNVKNNEDFEIQELFIKKLLALRI